MLWNNLAIKGDKMKDVFIIGSKGIPAQYGGFETFVDNLVGDTENTEIKYHVTCLSHENSTFEYKNAECINIAIPEIGPAKAVLYDIKAFDKCIQLIKERKIEDAIVYVLACRMGPFVRARKNRLHKLGGHYLLNPDGHEWLRAKWNWAIKKYWKISEKHMVKNADYVICDSISIEKYIQKEYAKYHPDTTFIAYGATVPNEKKEGISPKTREFYNEHGMTKDGYYLIVGRFVPENNYATMIKEFMKSKSKRQLVIVTNTSEGHLYNQLLEETGFDKDERINFVGTVYDQELLTEIRQNAHGYLHGHEVGGTNPSLLEALAATELNLLLDVGFNKEVGQDAALYWNKEDHNLASLIEQADELSGEKITEMGKAAKERIQNAYSWKYICEQYRKAFLKFYEKKTKTLLVDQIAKVNYKYSFSLAEAIKKQDVDITLVIDQKEEAENCTCRRIRLFNTDEKNIGKLKKLINYFSSMKKILKMLKKESYDVVHTQWVIFAPLDYHYLKKIKKNCGKLVVTIHDILPFNEKFYDKYYHQKIYELADEIIVQTDANVERFKELFPNMNPNLHMIPHGHFLDYVEKCDKEVAREKLNIAKDKFVILFFGQIKKVKGVGVLLEAFAKALETRKDMYLVIAGSVWKDDFSEYQAIIDEHNLSDYVRTDIKYIPDEDIKYYYGACDVCAMPYLDLYQSGVIQLVYGYQKPAIASDLDAFSNIVLDQETGYVFEKGNADALAKKILQSIDEKDSLVAKGLAGYELIKEKFNWEDIGENVVKAYQKQLETINIMGVNIAAINMNWIMRYLEDNIKKLSGDYICVSNVHTTVMSYEDPEYCKIQNGGVMAIPDGGPLSSVGRMRGKKHMGRTAGPTVMDEICKISPEKGYRHFFYGSTESTLEDLKNNLEQMYPGIIVAGMYSPPYRELTEEEDAEIIKLINDANADFVWVGLGAPKQERWMASHKGKINGLMLGVGAAFDYSAGNLKRAPEWMQRSSMEWFYRLLQEPKRLFTRYMTTNFKFIWHAIICGK